MTTDRMYNVLFLCTRNSARSILAEALLNREGAGRFRGFSAGSHPQGSVHPLALELLKREGLPIEGLRSKSWNEYASPQSPAMHFIFTVCDNAAAEICPIWPGHPVSAHWGIPDPAAALGSEDERRKAFRAAFQTLHDRITRLVALPVASLEPGKLNAALRAIGHPTKT